MMIRSLTTKRIVFISLLVLACFSLTLVCAPRAIAKGKYRVISAKLSQKWKGDWCTPKWTQTKDAKGYPVGCGPTAWAIVYAYWERFRGKDNLFIGGRLNSNSSAGDTMVDNVTRTVARMVKTDYYIPKTGVAKGKKSGGTKNKNMCLGIKYAKQQGYGHSRCFRSRGTEFNKFDHVARHLRSGRPVILTMHDDPERKDTRGASNHFVVIEEAYKKQKMVAGKWRDRDVYYVVNDGNNSRRKIWVREKGVNKHKVYSSFSMYFITVSNRAMKGVKDINSEACYEWCQGKKKCSRCSKLPACGPGYSPMKKFTGAGKDWYACEKRKSRKQASRDNKKACQDWCGGNSKCKKCSRKPGCGIGYKTMKGWTGRGNNWYACKKR
jgi:hypothetical protein